MPAYSKRYIENSVKDDLKHKMVFISGPRQSGKTTLAKHLCSKEGFDIEQRYINYDSLEDREKIVYEMFPSGSGYLVLDEIHKFSRWRQVVKGLYDKRGEELQILVTGSARLDYYRRGGDSLQGRYHFHRLLPLTFNELEVKGRDTIDNLMTYGGFPEPFFRQSQKHTKRWSREYRSRFVHEDLADLENVKDLSLIENMVFRLPDLVGSPLSINSLRLDLQVSHQSIARWINMLENLYMIFRIYPFGAPKIRAVKKEAKHYHFDWTLINEKGKRFENLIACHLLKWCFFMQDTFGREIELRYFRDVDRREVDFVIIEDGKPIYFIESKSRGRTINRPLYYLKTRFPGVKAVQVILESNIDLVSKDDIRVCSAHIFLDEFV